jgi:SOS-response transcriptional repressor LexA
MSRSKDGLTPSKRKDEVLLHLKSLQDKGHVGASIRQLAKAIGCSNEPAFNAVESLIGDGLVIKGSIVDKGRKGGVIRLTDAGRTRAALLASPQISEVEPAAGGPVHAEETGASRRSLSEVLWRHPKDIAARVRGSSMEAANIHDQDYVVVYSCPLRDLNTGDMVVASLVQGDIAEVTLKLWRRTPSGIELHPASAGGVNSQGRPHSVQEYQPDAVASALKVRWIICNHPHQTALSV